MERLKRTWIIELKEWSGDAHQKYCVTISNHIDVL